MFKGAIDNLHPDRAGGWMFSSQGTLRGFTVFAFVGDRCVGAGKIELFRQDLADAGLGDGYLGFDFPISLSNPFEMGRVTVKIDGSDAFILSPYSKVIASTRASGFAGMHHTLDSIEWMRSRGWLSNIDLMFLKSVQQLGVFEYSLIKPKTQAKSDEGILDAMATATELLQLGALTASTISRLSLDKFDRNSLTNSVLDEIPLPFPLVAVHAEWSGTVVVNEGSHHDDIAHISLEGAISYPIGPNRLLFVNLLCSFEVLDGPVGRSLTVYAA